MRDVVIIGAGLAGSSLAAALGSLGWDVLLLERRHLPHHKVCGEFLSPESQASLYALGLYDTVAALAPSRMARARLVAPRGASMPVALPGSAWGVSRFALDQALAQAAARAGAEVQMGVTATAIQPTAAGYTVELRTPQGRSSVATRALVAACGRHPLPGLRPQSVEVTADTRPSYVGVKCHYAGVQMPPQVDLFLFRGGYVGLSPIEAGRFNLCLLARREAFTQVGGNIRAMLAAVARWNPALSAQLAGSRPLPETEVAVAPVDTGVPPVPWDQCARLGDAAVMIPPLCGDGMAMALRAAELCAPLLHDFLRGERTADGWAEAYRAAWHREFDQPVQTGRRLQALLSMPGLADGLLHLGNLLPPLAEHLVRATRGRPRPLETVPRIG
jgi:flavin-dependent dehydrogenase